MFQFTVTLDITVASYSVKLVFCYSSITIIQTLLATKQIRTQQ